MSKQEAFVLVGSVAFLVMLVMWLGLLFSILNVIGSVNQIERTLRERLPVVEAAK